MAPHLLVSPALRTCHGDTTPPWTSRGEADHTGERPGRPAGRCEPGSPSPAALSQKAQDENLQGYHRQRQGLRQGAHFQSVCHLSHLLLSLGGRLVQHQAKGPKHPSAVGWSRGNAQGPSPLLPRDWVPGSFCTASQVTQPLGATCPIQCPMGRPSAACGVDADQLCAGSTLPSARHQ